MPSHIAHNKIYKDVFSELPERMKKEHRYTWSKYKIFAEGHDLIYSFLLAAPHKAIKYYKELPRIRDSEIQALSINYIDRLYESNQLDETKLFLYGYLIHHFFDAKLHPFIIYQTGDYMSSGEAGFYHQLLENMIDALLIKRQGIKPKSYLIHTLVNTTESLTNDTRYVIRESFYETYGYEKFDKLFANYNKNVKRWLLVMMHDPWGIKYYASKPFSTFIKSIKALQACQFRFDGSEAEKYLNNERSQWNNPANKDDTCNKSFDDLYEESLAEISSMISLLDEAINDKANNNEIKSIVPNISSTHGYEDPTLKLVYMKDNINIRRK